MGETGLDARDLQPLFQSVSRGAPATWSDKTRGPRLPIKDFETTPRIQTDGNAVAAILVLPVMLYVGRGIAKDNAVLANLESNDTQHALRIVVATYAAYAPVILDAHHLALLDPNQVGASYTTLNEATRHAKNLNHQSYTAYLNAYQAGALSGIDLWDYTDPLTPPQDQPGFRVGAPANQAAIIKSAMSGTL